MQKVPKLHVQGLEDRVAPARFVGPTSVYALMNVFNQKAAVLQTQIDAELNDGDDGNTKDDVRANKLDGKLDKLTDKLTAKVDKLIAKGKFHQAAHKILHALKHVNKWSHRADAFVIDPVDDGGYGDGSKDDGGGLGEDSIDVIGAGDSATDVGGTDTDTGGTATDTGVATADTGGGLVDTGSTK